MGTMSWLSKLVLGSEKAERTQAAKEKFVKTLNGHRFDADNMRAELALILHDVEEKAYAISVPPPANNGASTDDRPSGSGHQPAPRRKKVGVG